ncbi:protein TAB2 homolog, chloroplastic-like [Vicia villosa]|uniref:protein TAB2 homolog, chloroplastic-like n=1 Tax=Vicia villosa TaxID=3911 RepID=UPI00273BFB4C|nr:protein TAB2 homolog, chloroplastic-like [Vicia villosa]
MIKWNAYKVSNMILKVDGSRLDNPSVSDFGAWVYGFAGNIDYSNILRAELIAIYHGLRKPKEFGIKNHLGVWVCFRPILDAKGKKLWELVVCDKSPSLQYTKYFPNNVINSITNIMSTYCVCATCDSVGLITFVVARAQMQTIITKACKELGMRALPSKRVSCVVLWLINYEVCNFKHCLLPLDNPFPTKLPEDLFGERWAFVQLPYSAVREEASASEERFGYGSGLDLDLLGIDIDEKTLIPGLAVASSRAKILSAFMNGLELCAIEADTARANLTLSVAISTRYVYATYQKSPASTKEAEAWEAAKKASGGLHFLAIQDELDSENCVGFWLLLDLPPPPPV